MQQSQTQNPSAHRSSIGSRSSLSATTNALLNGILPTHRFSQTSVTVPTFAANLTPNQLQALQKTNNQIKRSEKIKHASVILLLAIIFALLFLTTIEFAVKLVRIPSKSSNLTTSNNLTNSKEEPIRAFFVSVWIFNSLLCIICLIIHSIFVQRRSRRGRTTAVFFREFIRVFDNGKISSNSSLMDCLLKSSLLCFLWYLSCYFIFRSMTTLMSTEIIILYSISATSRQLLGWIVLHEQFIGNKIIAYIISLSAFLFLAHNDGFRFNTFLLALSMVTFAVGLKTVFDVLINSFIRQLTSTKLRIVMINVGLCGTCLSWPLILLLHLTDIERFELKHIRWLFTMSTLVCGLAFNILTIVIPFRYSSVVNVACLLFVIPSTCMIDRYWLKITYSPLVISAILCSFAGVLLSIIPKQWFQASETTKMKQALGLINKDLTTHLGPMGTSGPATTTGTSSAFDEIRAQRRLKNALLFNEVKT